MNGSDLKKFNTSDVFLNCSLNTSSYLMTAEKGVFLLWPQAGKKLDFQESISLTFSTLVKPTILCRSITAFVWTSRVPFVSGALTVLLLDLLPLHHWSSSLPSVHCLLSTCQGVPVLLSLNFLFGFWEFFSHPGRLNSAGFLPGFCLFCYLLRPELLQITDSNLFGFVPLSVPVVQTLCCTDKLALTHLNMYLEPSFGNAL